MSSLLVNTAKIVENIKKVDGFLRENGFSWTLVLKVLGGNSGVLESILNRDIVRNLHSVADSRLVNLKLIKDINPDVTTMFIKPTPLDEIEEIVDYADISLSTSIESIMAINRVAAKRGKIHRIIIMIELGELREGILRENTVSFYSKVFELEHVEIIGLGTNLGCMYGVEPTYDKLMQLSLYRELIQAKFKRELPIVSGGSSITLPLVEKRKIPPKMNHFRVGEAVFLGTSPLTNSRFMDLNEDAFTFRGSIIELKKKTLCPEGKLCDGNVGHVSKNGSQHCWERHYRAVVDFGILDVDASALKPLDETVSFVGETSDMSVYDLGSKKNEMKVGDTISFRPDYMGVARLMASRYLCDVKLTGQEK